MVFLAISVCQKESKCFHFAAFTCWISSLLLKKANLCGSARGLPMCLHKGWWECVRGLLRQKGLMPLQNLFILNVYQIANPACQLCNFCYNFHPRRLFLFFFLNSFLGDAAAQHRLCFTLWLVSKHRPVGHSPFPSHGHPHRHVGAISLLERTVTPHQLLLATPTSPAAQPKEAGLKVFPDLTCKIIPS